MVRVKALKAFSSTVFGAVSPGDHFDMDAGYVKDMVAWGMIEDPAVTAGPTFEEWTAAGYAPEAYPPKGYPEKPSAGLTAYRAGLAKPTEPPAPLIIGVDPANGPDLTATVKFSPDGSATVVDPATAALEAAIAAAPKPTTGRRGRPKGSGRK